MTPINFNEQFKIRLSNNSSEAMDFHDVLKLLLVRKLKRRFKGNHYVKIYTEFPLEGFQLIPDIYIEDSKNKAVYCYEIQKELTPHYEKIKSDQYKKYEESLYLFNSLDFIIIPLKRCPKDFDKMNEFLEDYII